MDSIRDNRQNPLDVPKPYWLVLQLLFVRETSSSVDSRSFPIQ
jgi:hypothetical protein